MDVEKTYPGRRAPGGGEGSDEEVGAGDDGLGGRRVAHEHPGNVVQGGVGARVGGTVGALDGAGDEEPSHHHERASEQSGATTEAVEVEDGRESKGDVDDVLNRGSEEGRTDAGSLHDVDDVVHHDVHTAELRPHLNGHAEDDTLEHARSDESLERRDGLLTLEAKSFLNLVVLGKHLGVVDIAASVKVGENLKSLLPAVLAGEPTGRARQEEHADEQDSTGDNLDTPGNTEGGSALVGGLGAAVGEGGAVLDEVLDQDTPRQICQLLKRVVQVSVSYQVMAHCWSETTRPRISFAAISDW